MRNEYIAADAIVNELKQEGVEVAFGIVSIHNMPIYDAILREGSIHLVAARGESGAVNMADGYARATGKLGVVITSTGAGAGNGAGALTEAWNQSVPLLHITGEVESPYLGTGKRYIHETKDQQMMMLGASKNSYLIKNPLQIATIIRSAIAEAKEAPAGPITVNIPIDYQSAVVPKSQILNVKKESDVSEQTDAIHLPEEVILKIASSKRPVIWAGGGVIDSGANEELTRLAEKVGAPVITGTSGKGAIREDHPQCIGYFPGHPLSKELLKSSDLLISVGTHFRGNETGNWSIEIPEEHIGIDLDINAFNLNYPVSYGLVGDAKKVINKINEELEKQNIEQDKKYLIEIENIRKEVREQTRVSAHPYDEFADGMRRMMPENSIVVRDVTVPASFWGSRLVNAYAPRTSIYASGGGIGQGLPTAIGAQMGCKDSKVVLMAGDGGFMVNVGEMATAAQENLPLVVILFDDKGYGVLRGIQDAAYDRRVGVELFTPDFVPLGKSMGFEVERIYSVEEFNKELEIAMDRKGPSMIVVDMNTVGPMVQKISGSPEILKAFEPKSFKN